MSLEKGVLEVGDEILRLDLCMGLLVPIAQNKVTSVCKKWVWAGNSNDPKIWRFRPDCEKPHPSQGGVPYLESLHDGDLWSRSRFVVSEPVYFNNAVSVAAIESLYDLMKDSGREIFAPLFRGGLEDYVQEDGTLHPEVTQLITQLTAQLEQFRHSMLLFKEKESVVPKSLVNNPMEGFKG